MFHSGFDFDSVYQILMELFFLEHNENGKAHLFYIIIFQSIIGQFYSLKICQNNLLLKCVTYIFNRKYNKKKKFPSFKSPKLSSIVDLNIKVKKKVLKGKKKTFYRVVITF